MTTTRKRSAGSTAATSPRTSKRVKTAQSVSEHRNDLQDSDDDVDGQDHLVAASSSSTLTRLPSEVLQEHLPHQRSAILSRLSGEVTSSTPLVGLSDQASTLNTTLKSTIERGESNSILLVGVKGSGKSALLKTTLCGIATPHHHVYISALHCTTDRSAMRELARQLILSGALGLEGGEDVGRRFGIGEEDEREDEEDEEEEQSDGDGDGEGDGDAQADNADDDDDDLQTLDEKAALGTAVLSSLSSATSSILSLLASATSTSKPLLITLDHFDLLTARPRQALLYCLLDAVQSGTYKPGLAIVGMTRRVDTTDLLEKRVKSRFSHRIVQCYPPASADQWLALVEDVLKTGCERGDDVPFHTAWIQEVDSLLSQDTFTQFLTSTVELTHDVQHLFDVLYPHVSILSPTNPTLAIACTDQEDTTIKQLYDLPTLSFLFLIASKQLALRDRVVFNFEVAFDEIMRFSKRTRRERDAVGATLVGRTTDSPSARRKTGDPTTTIVPPWEDRQRAMMAFEHLLDLDIFLPDAFLSTLASVEKTTSSSTVTGAVSSTHAMRTSAASGSAPRKEYLRVRSAVDSYVVGQVAKARAAKGTLTVDVAQWAARSVV